MNSVWILKAVAPSTPLTSCGNKIPSALKRTHLYDLHLELKGKMVPFAGWEMPVQYTDSITNSHLHTRKKASLFDVSHMAQLSLTGKDRVRFLEKLVVADLQALTPGNAKLSLLTNEKGGIIDDTVITNKGDYIYMVVNAGCADKDIPHLEKHLSQFKAQGGDVALQRIDRSLIALQGPQAEAILARLVEGDVSSMPFMSSKDMKVGGVECFVSRCGYTGEDGFEISVPHDRVIELSKKILSHEDAKPAGLGARDTLRLEVKPFLIPTDHQAGLCLYGNDLTEDITPLEATLGWTIGKRRKEEGGFLGDKVILAQVNDPSLVQRKRVGFIVAGPPAREHATLHPLGDDSKVIGEMTSGSFSPVLNKAISMGYIHKDSAKVGTQVSIKVRGKLHEATVTKMPFVPSGYKK